MTNTVQSVREAQAAFSEKFHDVVSNIDSADFAELYRESNSTAIKELVEKTKSAAISALPEGTAIIPVSVRVSFSENENGQLLPVKVKVYAANNSRAKFTAELLLGSGETSTAITTFFEEVYVSLIKLSAEWANTAVLNELVAKILETAELPWGIEFEVTQNEGPAVLSISDELIVLSVNKDQIFDLDELVLFQDPADGVFSQELWDKIFAAEVAAARRAETTVGLLQKGKQIPIVKYFWNLNRTRIITVLKKTAKVTPERLPQYKKATDFHYQDNGVFAILHKDEDNNISVNLSPIDVETLERVEFDVLSAVS